MPNKVGLSSLMQQLRQLIARNELSSESVLNAIQKLSELNFNIYNMDKFPPLANTDKFIDNSGDTPNNLAEALLWKLGKWQIYKTFINNYTNSDAGVTADGGVVLSAFAMHLKNTDNPIYDQHAIRAIWAICEAFSDEEKQKCKLLLFDGSNYWKQTGSGDDGTCYKIFVKHISKICQKNNISNDEFDKLLMPLGQAIKKVTAIKKSERPSSDSTEYDNFIQLC